MTWGKREKGPAASNSEEGALFGIPEKALLFLESKRKSFEGGNGLGGAEALPLRVSQKLKLAKPQDLLSLPHVAVETASRTLEETASNCQRSIQNFGEVLQQSGAKYQKRLQETASNCQQNVAQLGDILQQSFPWESLQQAARGHQGILQQNSFPRDMLAIQQTLGRQMRTEAAKQEAAHIEDLLADEWSKPQKQVLQVVDARRDLE